MGNRTRATSLLAVLTLACIFASVNAQAGFAKGPQLKINAPWADSAAAGEQMSRWLSVENTGDEATSGTITVTDAFGSGFEPLLPEYTEIRYSAPGMEGACSIAGSAYNCTFTGELPPGAQVMIQTSAAVRPEATGTLTNSIAVSGGGAPGPVTSEQSVKIGPPGPFGFDQAGVSALNADGSQVAQAGSDPSDFTTTLEWRSFSSETYKTQITTKAVASVEPFKDVVAHLPPGFIGNPSATPALCTTSELAGKKHIGGDATNVSDCPSDSQVGLVHVYLAGESKIVGLFNMVAPYGAASLLGFQIYNTSILLYGYVRPRDHGIDIVSRLTSTSTPITRVEVTVWGDPFNPSHDRRRDLCLNGGIFIGATGEVCPSEAPRRAFLRVPTSCTGSPLQFGAESNSYANEDVWATASFDGPTLEGCELVPFSPQITVDPTGTAASSPTGVAVKVSLPQSQNPDGLAEADLKKAVVTLPEGMAINPSSADGLAVCDDAHLHLDSNVPADCPDGSKIGTVVLHTQLISNPIEGLIYLRPQKSFDPMSGEMFRMAFELRDDAHGLDFKIPGQIQANPVTGRLTTTFDDNPQFPFEDVSLNFKSGARAPLVTPATCQTQTTEADLYSWAEPDVAVHRASSFNLTSGAEGTPCPPPSAFAPAFSAGVTDVEAGNFTSFLSTFSRKDSDQSMQRVSVKMPKGLSGSLADLPLCPEPQASQGTCGPESQIGTTTAGAGAGPTPFYVTLGKVYMTGPYEGAPFGLSVVVPTKAGPFDLGTVVVRAKVEVDVHTAQLTVTTDPLPQVVGGVPVNLRLVNVTVNRPHFVFNPTDCAHAEVTGTMTGGEGATARLAKAFQVTNCGALKFAPKFTVSTSGRTSRKEGASLHAKLTYPKAPVGSQANIARVKVALPKRLPSRLTTLQKACTAETFAANPAACPGPSRIGSAVARTPILPVPLAGPVYFVSHGGEAFPDLVVVLQGYGVTIELVGTTFISKAGITSTTFKTVPDVPVGTFELKLPQGKYSALAANGNLCASKLKMPTSFVAQDGMEIHENTPIAVTGCAKHKIKHKHKHKTNKKKR
jgi:hypothetical protein